MKGIIPNFQKFSNIIRGIYKQVQNNKNGNVATYIPELAKVNPDLFGVSLCTISGQRNSFGDYKEPFCVQSCSKPISYLMAVEEHGFDHVHEHVGCEPSGVEFNKLILKEVSENKKIPHNPMVNAGAIISCSLIGDKLSISEKFNKVMDTWTKLGGNTKVGYQNATYLSEKTTADRNMCIGYMMQEFNSFPPNTNMLEILDFYFQTCSVEYNCEQLSILAATLANGGINPVTKEKIFEPENVKNCLSLMSSSGMYDYSGEWLFKVGIPAKSGVSGCIFLVIPGKMGIAIYSPRIDKNGNSSRGIDFANELTNTFNFHQYDINIPGLKTTKIDPTTDF